MLILLIARFSPNAASVRLAEQDRLDRAEGAELYPRIPYEKFRHLVLDLLESLGFHVAMEHASKDEIDIICKSTEPLRQARFIVHAIHAAPRESPRPPGSGRPPPARSRPTGPPPAPQ